jgi:hypothetical protein
MIRLVSELCDSYPDAQRLYPKLLTNQIMLLKFVFRASVTLMYLLGISFQLTVGNRPLDSVVVFTKGEGGYFCHKIPYLYRTCNGTLLALAEGRGRDGRASCDDFAV